MTEGMRYERGLSSTFVVAAAPGTRAVFISFAPFIEDGGETWTEPVVAWRCVIIEWPDRELETWQPLIQDRDTLTEPKDFSDFYCVLGPGESLTRADQREIDLRRAEQDVGSLERVFAAPALGERQGGKRERPESRRRRSEPPQKRLTDEEEQALIERILNG